MNILKIWSEILKELKENSKICGELLIINFNKIDCIFSVFTLKKSWCIFFMKNWHVFLQNDFKFLIDLDPYWKSWYKIKIPLKNQKMKNLMLFLSMNINLNNFFLFYDYLIVILQKIKNKIRNYVPWPMIHNDSYNEDGRVAIQEGTIKKKIKCPFKYTKIIERFDKSTHADSIIFYLIKFLLSL